MQYEAPAPIVNDEGRFFICIPPVTKTNGTETFKPRCRHAVFLHPLSDLRDAGEILAYDVKLYVHPVARTYTLEIGMLESVGDNGNAKR